MFITVDVPDTNLDGAVVELSVDEWGIMTADVRIPAPDDART